MQVGIGRAANWAVFAAHFSVGSEQVGMGRLEFFELLVSDEIMDGLIVAFADLDQVRRIIALGGSLLDVIGKITPLTADVRGMFIERFQQLEYLLKLFLREFLPIGQAAQLDFLGAVLD